MKISRAFVHRYLISYSCSCTGLPGRLPRTAAVQCQRTGGSNSSTSAAGARGLTFKEAVDDRIEVYLRSCVRHV